jgi:hypothetical protein
MLYEPIQYVVTGKRIVDEDICETLEKIGKEEALYRMWKGSMPYLQSIANKVCARALSRFRLGGVALRVRSSLGLARQELNAAAADALANPPKH